MFEKQITCNGANFFMQEYVEPLCPVLKVNQDVSRDHERSNSKNFISAVSQVVIQRLHQLMSMRLKCEVDCYWEKKRNYFRNNP